MKKTILNSLFLSLSLVAMEDHDANFKVDYHHDSKSEIATFQRELWRLKKYLATLPKPEKRMRCPRKIYDIVQENAAQELEKRKKAHPQQYATPNSLYEDKQRRLNKKKTVKEKNKEESKSIKKYKKIPLWFAHENNQEKRYWVQDTHGNNIIYSTCVPAHQLSKDVKEKLVSMRNQRVALSMDNGDLDIYYLDNSIEAFTDKQVEMEYFTKLAITKTNTFMKKLKARLLVQENDFKNSKEKNIKKLSSIIAQKKDFILYEDLIAQYGEDLFHEKMLYTLEVQDRVNYIDNHQDIIPYITIKWIDGESYLYAFKDKGTYYLFGVLLEPDATDAEYEIKGYKFADKLAEWKKPIISKNTNSNSEHLSPA